MTTLRTSTPVKLRRRLTDKEVKFQAYIQARKLVRSNKKVPKRIQALALSWVSQYLH